MTFGVYRESTPAGNRFWAFIHNGNGNYSMTARSYPNPVTAVRQIVSPWGNKAYAGRRQHVTQFINSRRMNKVNMGTLGQLIRMQNRNLLNKIQAAATLRSMR